MTENYVFVIRSNKKQDVENDFVLLKHLSSKTNSCRKQNGNNAVVITHWHVQFRMRMICGSG